MSDRYTPCSACGGLDPLGPLDPAPAGSYACSCGERERDERDYERAMAAYDEAEKSDESPQIEEW
jgi:hypothetical protein